MYVCIDVCIILTINKTPFLCRYGPHFLMIHNTHTFIHTYIHTYLHTYIHTIRPTYLNRHDVLIDEVEEAQLLLHIKLNSATHHDARNLDERSLVEVHKRFLVNRYVCMYVCMYVGLGSSKYKNSINKEGNIQIDKLRGILGCLHIHT